MIILEYVPKNFYIVEVIYLLNIKKLETPFHVWDSEIVRVKEMGNITEVFFSEIHPKGAVIKKIDKEHYVDVRTGELHNFKHIENRSQDLISVSRSLGQGRDLLNTNIVNVSYCRWLTLTYADNMTDPKKLQKDFENFNKRLRDIFGHYEYITAAEPQGRGAWHLHVVLIFKDKAPFMENSIVANAWKQGFVTVKKLDDVDNVGAYLTAYLGDMEFSDFKEQFPFDTPKVINEVDIIDDTGQVQKKKFVKGARLCMYPPHFHIFRWSKGIKKPVVTRQSYKQAKEKVGSAKLTFQKSVILSDSDNGFETTLSYEYYNSIRK